MSCGAAVLHEAAVLEARPVVHLLHLDELAELLLALGLAHREESVHLLAHPKLQLREPRDRRLLQQPVAERAQLVGHRAQAREARGQQLADRPLLRVLEHVLDHLDRRDGERQVVALAVAARLEQRLVGELRRVERRDVAQVRLKGDEMGSDMGDVGGMWEERCGA